MKSISSMTKAELVAEAAERGYPKPEDHSVQQLRKVVGRLRTRDLGDDLADNLKEDAAEAMEVLEAHAEPRPFDLAAVREARARRHEGFDFVLRGMTDRDGNPMPMTVKARIPDILDSDTMDDLPTSLRVTVFQIIDKVEKMEAEGGTDVDEMSTADLAESFGSVGKMAEAYVIAGFISPRVYETAEEADEKGGAWIKDIPFSDRLAFFEHCTRRERGAAKSLEPFPGR